MRTLILTEGGSQIGLGHISRCSSLYDELEERGINVEFIINGDTERFEIIKDKQYKVVNWLSKTFLTNYIRKSDYCIVDSYLADEELYQIISNQAKNALYVDDNGRIQYPKGIVVNPSLSTKAVKYPKNDVDCYLIGPKYIILRSSFIQVKREHVNPQVKEVLITLGGSDIVNLTPIIQKFFSEKYPDLHFNIVIGSSFKNLNELEKYYTKNIQFHFNLTSEEMKNLMLKSDICITAAGQTIYELLATQTPFIPIIVAENQKNNIIGLKELNLISENIDYKDLLFLNRLDEEFKAMLSFKRRKELIDKYHGIIDGLGAKRIINKLVCS